MPPPVALALHVADARKMVAHVEACLPEEACGLAAGTDGRVRLLALVSNSLHSPVAYKMDPSEQYAAFMRFEAAGLDLLAIFHSHPRGPAHPSPSDVRQFYYPGVISLILSPLPAEAELSRAALALQGAYYPWSIGAFRIEENRVNDVKLVLITENEQLPIN